MDNSAFISIVIPTYNRENEIVKTINSVLTQTYSNFEVIIVDDASIDLTIEQVEGILDPRIRLIKLEKNTKGRLPRNIGIQASKGEFIALLDSDDEWLPDKLEKQLKFINSIKEKHFICFTDIILSINGKEFKRKNETLDSYKNIMDYIFIGRNVVQTSTYFFPTEVGQKILFDSDLSKHQDWDFCLRLQKNNIRFYHFSEPLTKYFIDSSRNQISSNKNYEFSLWWAEKIKPDISLDAYLALQSVFLLIPNKFINGKQNTLKICSKSYFKGVISLLDLVKCILKIIFPNQVKEIYINVINYLKFIFKNEN